MRNKLTFTLTKCFIHALVFSIQSIDFGTDVPFFYFSLHLMHILETIQRRTVRILYKLGRRTMVYISSLMHSLGCLKFRLICKFRLLCITHRASYKAINEYHANLITISTDNIPRLVGSNMMLHQPITTTLYAESVFAAVAPKCWNALPYMHCIYGMHCCTNY